MCVFETFMIAWWRLKPFTISHGLGEDEKPVGETVI